MPAFHGLASARRNPLRPGRPSATHTPAGARRGGLASWGVGAAYRLQDAAVEEEGRRAVAAEERRGSRRGEKGRRGRCVRESRRVGDGDARRRRGGRTSARLSSPTAGDGAARVSGRSGASGRNGAARRRGAARRVGEEGRVGDGRSEEMRRRGEAASRTGASRKNDTIWGETVKCSGRWRGLYITPTFCHGLNYQHWQKAL
jgi:hypothetical protein